MVTLKALGEDLYALADGIRKQAAAGSVLDLGCCSFKFQRSAPARRRHARRSPQGTSVRPAR